MIHAACRKLIKEISKDPAGILVTSYEQMRIQKNLLTTVKWGYAILDEGHKIRNPDADVTLVAKQVQTVRFYPCILLLILCIIRSLCRPQRMTPTLVG